MDSTIKTMLENIHTKDRPLQTQAFFDLIAATDQPVDWAYEVWDDLIGYLKDTDNHERAIAAQVLANLAKSDPDGRMLRDFDKLLQMTRDTRSVTARHSLQALWKVGVAGKEQQKIYMEGLKRRFEECVTEKNVTLIRYDILQSMRNVYDQTHDESIRTTALALIETEDDPKYRKKYATLWRADKPQK